MADDPFYSPNRKLPPPREPQAGEPLWSIRANGATWEAELRDHGEYGVEVQILKQGELVIGRRFDTRELAVLWAQEEGRRLSGTPSRQDVSLRSMWTPSSTKLPEGLQWTLIVSLWLPPSERR